MATASSAAPIGPGASSALGGSTWPRRGGRSTRRGAAACVKTRGSVLKAPSPKPRLSRARAPLLRLPRTRPVALGSSYLSRRAAGPTSAAQPGLRVLERAVSKVADTTLPLTTQACGYVTYSHHPSDTQARLRALVLSVRLRRRRSDHRLRRRRRARPAGGLPHLLDRHHGAHLPRRRTLGEHRPEPEPEPEPEPQPQP